MMPMTNRDGAGPTSCSRPATSRLAWSWRRSRATWQRADAQLVLPEAGVCNTDVGSEARNPSGPSGAPEPSLSACGGRRLHSASTNPRSGCCGSRLKEAQECSALGWVSIKTVAALRRTPCGTLLGDV